MPHDLETLSLDELKTLRKNVDASIKSFEKRMKKEALAAAQKAAQEFGFSLDEIVEGKAGSKGAPKYANPKDATSTWTGRGRQPNWVKAHLESGGSLDDLAI